MLEGKECKKAVIMELCKLQAITTDVLDPKAEYARDCICHRQIGSDNSIRNDCVGIAYLRRAVINQLERDGITEEVNFSFQPTLLEEVVQERLKELKNRFNA